MVIYISFLHRIVAHRLGTQTALLQLLNTVLNALPPVLPALLVVLRAVTVLRLRHQSIFLSDTQKLQTAAQLDLVLFDKTGTLTIGQVGQSQTALYVAKQKDCSELDHNLFATSSFGGKTAKIKMGQAGTNSIWLCEQAVLTPAVLTTGVFCIVPWVSDIQLNTLRLSALGLEYPTQHVALGFTYPT